MCVNTNDMTKEIKRGVSTDQNKPKIVLEYLFLKFFITNALSNALSLKNIFILKYL